MWGGGLAVLCALLAVGLAVRHRRMVRETAPLCEVCLRTIYLARRHLPRDIGDLPLEKAVAYTLGQDVGWMATPEEQTYLHAPEVFGDGVDISGQPDMIYCPADPAYRKESASVANMNTFTPSDQIAPSSYLWLPKDHPDWLTACPYHHLAVRQADGRIVSWSGSTR